MLWSGEQRPPPGGPILLFPANKSSVTGRDALRHKGLRDFPGAAATSPPNAA
jgi:hypothetical protein